MNLTPPPTSSYRRGKQQDVRARAGARVEKPKVKAKGTCIYCGEAGHGPAADDVEEGDLAWCAAGLESLQSVTRDRVREAMSTSDDTCPLEEMAADGFPESRAGMPVAICGFHQYREDITSASQFTSNE
ncbi:unnamed protein product [Gadus morhua 'NCC']